MSLISESGNVQLDLLVNEIKAKALKCLKVLWGYLFKKKPKQIYSASNLYVVSAQLYLYVFMNTLILLPKNPSKTLQDYMENGHIQSITLTALEVLGMLSSERECSHFYIQNSYKIYVQIILPYLKLTEKEADDLTEDPKEFVNYTSDICQNQKSKTHKS